MQHATNRPRAHSESEIPTPSRADMELQPMGTQAEASLHSVDETAVPSQQEILTTPAIEPRTLHDLRASGSSNTVAIPELAISAEAAIGIPTSDRPFAKEATTPEQERIPTTVIPKWQPRSTSKRLDSHTTTHKSHPIEPEESRPVKQRTHSPTHEGPTSSRECYLEIYRSRLLQPNPDQFCSILGRERDFRATLTHPISGGDMVSYPWTPSDIELVWGCKRDILVIEDVDIRCILALDAKFNLDPKFFLQYVGSKGLGAPQQFLDDARWPDHGSHLADEGMAGSWCVTSGRINGDFPWQMYEPLLTAWQSALKVVNRDKVTNAKRPWWQGTCRQSDQGFEHQIRSTVACYCLSNELRKLRP